MNSELVLSFPLLNREFSVAHHGILLLEWGFLFASTNVPIFESLDTCISKNYDCYKNCYEV